MHRDKSRHVKYEHKGRSGKAKTLFLSLLLISIVVIGGTLAYLLTKTESLTNVFQPSSVSCSVTEESFDGTTKTNVNVKNTSDIDAYIRVKLVTYRVNDAGQNIGGAAVIPDFTPGAGWVKHGDYYYYTSPVQPGESPATALIGSIALTGSYSDADGGKQVIEVMAEAIQSIPAEAVGNSWGVSISPGVVAPY